MELAIRPLGTSCAASARPFAEGDAVVSVLLRLPDGTYERLDCAEDQVGALARPGTPVCRWRQVYKPRPDAGAAARAQKMSAEALLLEVFGSGTEPDPQNLELVQFLALFLERRRVLRARGATPEGLRIYDHPRLARTFHVPAGEPTPERMIALSEAVAPALS